jgi:hypothetical protein
MNPSTFLAALGAIIFGAVGIVFYLVFHVFQIHQTPQTFGSLELGICDVTETAAVIGDDNATVILHEDPSRQWAIIQQPLNATNTVSLSIGGTAAKNSGYVLSPATTTNVARELILGFSTDIRTADAVTAITSTASTTINVIDCN